MLLFLIIAFLRITFHIFLSSLYNFLPYRVPGYPIALLPSSSLTSPFYVCSYISPLAMLLSLAGFCLSCFCFSLTFSLHLDHQTSWISCFLTWLVDDDLIYSIPSSFPGHSHTNSLLPASNSFLPNVLTLQLCQLIPKIRYSQAVLSDVWQYIPERVSAQAGTSNHCTALKLFFSGELLGITTKLDGIRHSFSGSKGRSHRHWCFPRHCDCKAHCIFILRFPAFYVYNILTARGKEICITQNFRCVVCFMQFVTVLEVW